MLKKTSTGASTDASVLQQLAEEGHQLPVLLMEYRELVQAREHVHRRAAGATSIRRPGASTHRSARQWRPPDGCRRAIRIFRTFQFAASWVETFDAVSFRGRAGRSSPPTTRRSSCVCSPTCRATRRSCSAFQSGGDIHRQTAALIFDVPLDQVTRKCAREPRRSTSRRSMARARTLCLASSRSRTPRQRSSSSNTSSGSRAFANTSTRWSSSRGSTATCKRSSIDAGTSTSCATAISISARSGSGLLPIRRSRAQPPI